MTEGPRPPWAPAAEGLRCPGGGRREPRGSGEISEQSHAGAWSQQLIWVGPAGLALVRRPQREPEEGFGSKVGRLQAAAGSARATRSAECVPCTRRSRQALRPPLLLGGRGGRALPEASPGFLRSAPSDGAGLDTAGFLSLKHKKSCFQVL